MGGSGFYLESNWKSRCNIFMTGTVHGHKLFKMLSCVSTENDNIIHVHVTLRIY